MIDSGISLHVSCSFWLVTLTGYFIPRMLRSCLRWNEFSWSSRCFVRPHVPQLYNSMDFMRLLYSFNFVFFYLSGSTLHLVLRVQWWKVLSSPIKDPTFFTIRQFSSDLIVFLLIHVYSNFSVFMLSWCGRSFFEFFLHPCNL